jgi:hypothetical protein
MQLKRVSRKTPSAYLFPARRRFGGGLYTMVSSFMPLFAGRIDHGHAVRFAEGPERVHVVAARKLEGGQIEPREPSIKFNQSLYK